MIEKASKEQQLASLEKIIEQSKNVAEKHFYECGKALWKIKENKLHKQHTFEQYCRQRWGFTRRRGYQLIEAYETVKLLEDKAPDVNHGTHSEPDSAPKPEEIKTERQARAYAKKTKDAKKKSEPKVVIETDKEGYPIPGPAMAIWNRRGEVKDKLQSLSELRQWAEDMQGSDDPLYAEVVFSGLKLDIEKVIITLKGAVPHAVCTSCQGQAPKTCAFCKGRGMVSRFLYQSPATPEEVKVMRAMA